MTPARPAVEMELRGGFSYTKTLLRIHKPGGGWTLRKVNLWSISPTGLCISLVCPCAIRVKHCCVQQTERVRAHAHAIHSLTYTTVHLLSLFPALVVVKHLDT